MADQDRIVELGAACGTNGQECRQQDVMSGDACNHIGGWSMQLDPLYRDGNDDSTIQT
jgi:hypothetical protein